MVRRKNLLGFVGLALFLLCGPIVASAQSPQQIAEKALSATVLLVMEDSNGQPLSIGSGFFVRSGQIATNLHVLEGAARGYAKLVSQKTKHDIEGIMAVDAARDLVILKIPALRVPPLSLGNSDMVRVGESVYAAGNPRGLEGTFSQGIISSIRSVGMDKLLQITAPISPGSSGGPVLNGRGQVIGVSVATFRNGQNLNFAIPSNYLKALVAKVGQAKPLTQARQPNSQRSILNDLGGRSAEGVIGGKFLWDLNTGGLYSFSLRNRLRQNVRDVYCFVIFFDEQNEPIDVDTVHFQGLIPAGLAKRVKSQVDRSTQKLTTLFPSKTPHTKVEFRILNFEIME